MGWRIFVRAPLLLVGSLAMAVVTSPELAFIPLVLNRVCGGSNGVEPGQSNSFACSAAIPSHVWENEIAVLSPVRPNGKVSTLYRPEDTSFVGDVDLYWDGDRLLFTGVRKPCRFQIFEIGIDGRGLRERVRDQHPDVDNATRATCLTGASSSTRPLPCRACPAPGAASAWPTCIPGPMPRAAASAGCASIWTRPTRHRWPMTAASSTPAGSTLT